MANWKTIKVKQGLYEWIKYQVRELNLSISDFPTMRLRGQEPKKFSSKRRRKSVPIAVLTNVDIDNLERERRKYRGVPPGVVVKDRR